MPDYPKGLISRAPEKIRRTPFGPIRVISKIDLKAGIEANEHRLKELAEQLEGMEEGEEKEALLDEQDARKRIMEVLKKGAPVRCVAGQLEFEEQAQQ